MKNRLLRVHETFLGVLRDTRWNDDFRKVGSGLVIASVATPAFSDHGKLSSALIVGMIGIVLLVVPKVREK